MAEETTPVIDPELEMLQREKMSGYKYRERRHPDWTTTYELYRDKVVTNRLTQRQSVNIPLMKMSIRTLLKDVDDMPVLYYENLDNDKEAELFKNEYWKQMMVDNKMELQDIVDKRQVFLFGRSFDQWQIVDGKVKMTVQDPMDILVDRHVDPFNIHSSRFLIHANIFVPLASLELNEMYNKIALGKIKDWKNSDEGILKDGTNELLLIEKNEKLSDMGVTDINDPVLGETYIELVMYFCYRPSDKAENGEEIFLYIVAEGREIIFKKRLEDVIGVTTDHFWQTHYPYVSWADDLERQDFWSDGVGDTIRPTNQIINVYHSQKVENRTLRSMGMHYYDATIEGFAPQTYQPIGFGWYGVPGKPDDVVQKVDLPDLSDSMEDINFLMSVNEKATGATAGQEGVPTQRQITLGEFQATLTEAKERVKGMSKFYTPAWQERGLIFSKLVEAGADKLDAVKIFIKGKNSNDIYSREIGPGDWQSKEGYRCKVWSQEDKNQQDENALQKMNALKMTMPDNPKVDEIYKRKLTEYAGLTPDETNDVMKFEEQKRQAMLSMVGNGLEMPGMPAVDQSGQPIQKPPMQMPAGAGYN